jgi:hypothetical protein
MRQRGGVAGTEIPPSLRMGLGDRAPKTRVSIQHALDRHALSNRDVLRYFQPADFDSSFRD